MSVLILTEASRAYLIEPHWYVLLVVACPFLPLSLSDTTEESMVDGRLTHDANPRRNPTVEELALARVHRLGQQKEVKTVGFFC